MANDQQRESPTRGVVGGQPTADAQRRRATFSARGPDNIQTALPRTHVQEGPTGIGPALEVATKVGTNIYKDVQRRKIEQAAEDLKKIGIADNAGFSEQEMETLFEGKKVFDRYRRARAQGAMTDDAANIAIEAEVKRLSSQFPALRTDIRRMASTILGFDPTGSEYEFATQDATQSLTPFQKKQAELADHARRLGVPVNAVLDMHARNEVLKIQKETYENNLTMGEGTRANVGAYYSTLARQDTEEFITEASSVMSSAEGTSGFTPEIRSSLLQNLNTRKNTLISEYQAEASRRNIPRTEREDVVDRINQVYSDKEELLSANKFWDNIQTTTQGRDTLQRAVLLDHLPLVNKMRLVFGDDKALDSYMLFAESDDPRIEALRRNYINTDPLLRDIDANFNQTNTALARKLQAIREGNYNNLGNQEQVGDTLTITHRALGDNVTLMDSTQEEYGDTSFGDAVLSGMSENNLRAQSMDNIISNPNKYLQSESNVRHVQKYIKESPTYMLDALEELTAEGWFLEPEMSDVEIVFDKERGEYIVDMPSESGFRKTPIGPFSMMFRSFGVRDKINTINKTLQLLENPQAQRRLGTTQEEYIKSINKSLNLAKKASQEGSSIDAVRAAMAESERPVKRDLVAQASKIASERGINPRLFNRLIQAESNWNPEAKSDRGAVGLGQLKPEAARDMGLAVGEGKDDRLDPTANLTASADYLTWLSQRPWIGGDRVLTVAAYNMGPEALREALQERGKIPKETVAYVNKVLGVDIREYIRGM